MATLLPSKILMQSFGRDFYFMSKQTAQTNKRNHNKLRERHFTVELGGILWFRVRTHKAMLVMTEGHYRKAGQFDRVVTNTFTDN